MSVRLDMLRAAKAAAKTLGESAERVAAFLRSQFNADGGFADRAGKSDLYYTVFGMAGLMALGADLPADAVASYLEEFGDGDGLDLVHLSCLARCHANLAGRCAPHPNGILDRVEAFCSADGGYNAAKGADRGTVYACFVAMGAYEDLGADLPRSEAMTACIERLRADDGGYANQVDLPVGMVPPTAAAVSLLRYLGTPIDPAVGRWLLDRSLKDGGFMASSMAPMPDLLSTATALHALRAMNVDISGIREPTLNFIDSLWINRGGFYGNWGDDALDCEYTYYGLLALGHLSQ